MKLQNKRNKKRINREKKINKSLDLIDDISDKIKNNIGSMMGQSMDMDNKMNLDFRKYNNNNKQFPTQCLACRKRLWD